MNRHTTNNSKHSHNEIIEPIKFEPLTKKKTPTSSSRSLVVVIVASCIVISLAYILWFTFAVRSVSIIVDPPDAQLTIKGSLIAPGYEDKYLLIPGIYTLKAARSGFYTKERLIEVTEQEQQEFLLRLEKLPGMLTVITRPSDEARVLVDDQDVGLTPIADLHLSAGSHKVVVQAERYREHQEQLNIVGGGVEQILEIELVPVWTTVALSTTPDSARVYVDGIEVGITPLQAELMEGEREILINMTGYKSWHKRLTVTANQPLVIRNIVLEKADSVLTVDTEPTGANVTVDGAFHGQTPLQLYLRPQTSYRIGLYKAGYQTTYKHIKLAEN